MPILIPTIYLWMVDLLSLQRGTWVIEHGTKLDIQFWGFLDIEYAQVNILSGYP
jgi:15-cis-phytoene synthase/lycopene beta-cyclase